MLTLQPIDRVATEKQLESPDAPVISAGVSTIDLTDVNGFFRGERSQEEEASTWHHSQESTTDASRDAPSNKWDLLVRSFALAFVGLLCATVIGFVSEIRPLKPDSPDYGYDEALGRGTSSPPSADFVSNCSGAGPATARASKGGSDRLGLSAIAAQATAGPTTNFTSSQ
jgi:hypothetical protein